MATGAAELTLAVTRMKREDHSRTKYDSQFSKWKVLIGPDDWENHSVGKEGVARYRVENLPESSSSGLYELAIYPNGSSSRDDPGKLDPDNLVVVYLGKADNVRTRLQQYGRTGAHLGGSCHGEKGCGCFQDVFSRGCSIVCRWIPTENNADAQRKETWLLNTYDYAWTKGSNGARRHDDILEKLDKRTFNHTTPAISSGKRLPFLQEQGGLKIIASKLLSQDNFFRQVFRVNRSQPRLLLDHGSFDKNDTITCGVPLEDGSICRRPPVEGRKRCAEHKGNKTNEISSFDKGSSGIILPGKEETGVAIQSPVFSEGCDTICGVEFCDGSFCTKQPVGGTIRCEDHKGMSVTSLLSGLDAKNKSDILDTDSRSNSCNWNYGGSSNGSISICGSPTQDGSSCQGSVNGDERCYSNDGNSSARYLDYDSSSSSICEAPTQDGCSCRRPFNGNERCGQHSNDGILSARYSNYGSSNSSTISEATTQDGCSCRRPVNGNERCGQHSNAGNPSARYSNYGGSNSSYICGAPIQDGYSYQRPVNDNERCWQHSNNGNSSARNSNYGSGSSYVCGARTLDGYSCQRPVNGNERCWQHSNNGNSSARNSNYGSGSSYVCGAWTLDGYSCQRPVNGNERCWQHSNNRNSSARYLDSDSNSSICGAPTQDGYYCQRTAKRNERCWQHSNHGSYGNYGGYTTSICGARTRNGSYCRRTVRGNGRCWQH